MFAQLTSYPPVEMARLHNGTLVDDKVVGLIPAKQYNLPLAEGDGSAMDLIVNFTLPLTATTLTVAIFNGSDVLHLLVSAPGPTRTVAITRQASIAQMQQGKGAHALQQGAEFKLQKDEEHLEVRVLVDRSVSEWFVGGGRMVVSRRVYPKMGWTGAYVAASTAVTVASITAFDMGCGWV
jgi:sucrose-6-phosphate hydrolase SacC (GH32 family)